MTLQEQVHEIFARTFTAVVEVGPAREPGVVLSQSELMEAFNLHIEGMWEAIRALAEAIDELPGSASS
jgi:hypothetical protein